jgi:TonB-linked SusC/RagA family outer membrane protein
MKKTLRCWVVLLLSVCSYQVALAQDKSISGTVTSSEDGSTMPGVSISVKGSTKGTTTDANGSYKIAVPSGGSLVFSFLGHDSQTIKVGNSSVIDITLKSVASNLNEVVVTALGVKQEKRALGYAVQEVKGQDLADTQRENFANALQGRVAGLSVTGTSGAPGASTSIMLRGVNSLSGSNQPLYIIDGLPVDNKTFNTGYLSSDRPGTVTGSVFNRTNDYSNRGSDINPEDIESITVLKGPEAAALYGIDAASGAIVITTKKGAKGRGKITYSNSFRFDEVYRFPETQTTYSQGTNGVSNTNVRRMFGPKYAEGTQLYDNLRNFFQTGTKQNHSLSIEGGNDNSTYRLSTSYLTQTGVVPTTKYDRINVTLSGTSKISEKFTSEATIAYSYANNVKASRGSGGYLLGLLTWPANDDASVYLTPAGTRRRLVSDVSDDIDVDNPFYDVNKNLNTDKNNRVMTNIGLIYNPATWLNLTARVGMDVSSTQGMLKYHPESQRAFSVGGSIDTYVDNTRNLNLQYFATLKKNIGKFKSSLLVGNAIYDYNYTVASVRGEKFIDNEFTSINNTDLTTHRALNTLIRKRLVGIFGNATLNYDDLVYLTLTGRNDVSSTLPKVNNSFFYPSAQLSFIFTELPMLKESSVLSYGKLRASMAQVGKDAPPYSLYPGLENKTTTGGGYGYGFTGPSPDLKPEKTTSKEIGTELKFFKGRLGLDVAYYNSKSEDQIVKDLRLSYGTGFILQVFNGGTLQNQGVEIQLSGTPIKRSDFTWTTLFNFTKTNSKLLSLPQDLPEYYVSDTWVYQNVRNGVKPGFPLTTLTGVAYSRSTAGDILINPTTGLPVRNTAVFANIGDRNPDFMIGLSNNITYKNFNLSFLFDIRKGGDVFNGNELYLWINGASKRSIDREQPIVYKGVLRDGLENTATPTVNTIQVNPSTVNDYYRTTFIEEDFIEKDINWLRLKDITLAYRFPKAMLSKSKVFQSASLFVTATDLFMLTNYSGADPSVNGVTAGVGGSGGAGIDYGVVSTPRGINFGVKIGL